MPHCHISTILQKSDEFYGYESPIRLITLTDEIFIGSRSLARQSSSSHGQEVLSFVIFLMIDSRCKATQFLVVFSPIKAVITLNLLFQILLHLNPVKVPSTLTVNWMRQRTSKLKATKITSMTSAKGDRGHISPHSNCKNWKRFLPEIGIQISAPEKTLPCGPH